MAIVTLTTDFGLQDAYVGTMKGVMLSISPGLELVDLNHQVPPQNILAGAFTLYQAAPFFPANTVHLAVVDPGVGSQRRAVAVRTKYGSFVSPDNGLLTLILRLWPDYTAVELDNEKYHLAHASATFHGRDIFAPAAAHLAAGVSLPTLGTPISNLVSLPLPQPEILNDGQIIAHVMYIDHFGNLFLDVTADQVPEPSRFEIAGKQVQGTKRTFSDVAEDELVVYSGSTRGHLEIAIRKGDAARILGLKVGDLIRILRRETD